MARRDGARDEVEGKAKLESGSLASVLLVFCPPSSPVPEESSSASRRLSSLFSLPSYRFLSQSLSALSSLFLSDSGISPIRFGFRSLHDVEFPSVLSSLPILLVSFFSSWTASSSRPSLALFFFSSPFAARFAEEL